MKAEFTLPLDLETTMKRLAAVAVVLLSCSAARAENFTIFGRGNQLYQGSYSNSGGFMVGPGGQVTQWIGRPAALPVPMMQPSYGYQPFVPTYVPQYTYSPSYFYTPYGYTPRFGYRVNR